MVDFVADGNYVINNGEKMDVDDISTTTQNCTCISDNKGIADAFGEWGPGALQDAGYSITLAALPIVLQDLEFLWLLLWQKLEVVYLLLV
jgi:hypothetical protein